MSTQGFYVNPISCKHLQPDEFDKCINTSIFTESSISLPSHCHSCNDSSENWICLSCGVISCSRHVNGHAGEHYESTKHPISASFSDHSFWCYTCDTYVHDKCLFEILDILQTIKFYSDKNDNNHQEFEDISKRVNDLNINEHDNLVEASVTSFSTSTTTTTTTNNSRIESTKTTTQKIESIEDDQKSSVTITTTTNTIITNNNNNNNSKSNLNNSANNIKPHELNRFSNELDDHHDDEEDDAKSSSSSSSSEGPNVGFIQRMIEMFKKKTYTFRESIFVQPTLQETTLSGIATYIKNNQCKNIIVMTGAGISVAAGIPDFRSPKTGLYDSLDKYNLPYKEAIFDIEYFRENPKPFFVLSKELYPGNFKPTMVHYFIKLLHQKGLLLRNYTQNIDTLERVAGIPASHLVEAHGSFATCHCIKCKAKFDTDYVKDRIFKDEIPYCNICRGIVKPDIVFFGESLPNRFNNLMEEDFPKCDLLIVIGTSLKVQPFASLVNFAIDVPRLLINYEEVGVNPYGGFKFNDPQNKLDVKWIGDCQQGILEFAEKLDWKNELEKLYNNK